MSRASNININVHVNEEFKGTMSFPIQTFADSSPVANSEEDPVRVVINNRNFATEDSEEAKKEERKKEKSKKGAKKSVPLVPDSYYINESGQSTSERQSTQSGQSTSERQSTQSGHSTSKRQLIQDDQSARNTTSTSELQSDRSSKSNSERQSTRSTRSTPKRKKHGINDLISVPSLSLNSSVGNQSLTSVSTPESRRKELERQFEERSKALFKDKKAHARNLKISAPVAGTDRKTNLAKRSYFGKGLTRRDFGSSLATGKATQNEKDLTRKGFGSSLNTAKANDAKSLDTITSSERTLKKRNSVDNSVKESKNGDKIASNSKSSKKSTQRVGENSLKILPSSPLLMTPKRSTADGASFQKSGKDSVYLLDVQYAGQAKVLENDDKIVGKWSGFEKLSQQRVGENQSKSLPSTPLLMTPKEITADKTSLRKSGKDSVYLLDAQLTGQTKESKKDDKDVGNSKSLPNTPLLLTPKTSTADEASLRKKDNVASTYFIDAQYAGQTKESKKDDKVASSSKSLPSTPLLMTARQSTADEASLRKSRNDSVYLFDAQFAGHVKESKKDDKISSNSKSLPSTPLLMTARGSTADEASLRKKDNVASSYFLDAQLTGQTKESKKDHKFVGNSKRSKSLSGFRQRAEKKASRSLSSTPLLMTARRSTADEASLRKSGKDSVYFLDAQFAGQVKESKKDDKGVGNSKSTKEKLAKSLPSTALSMTPKENTTDDASLNESGKDVVPSANLSETPLGEQVIEATVQGPDSNLEKEGKKVYLHRKVVTLNTTIDNVPLTTKVALTVKSRNKDAQIDIKQIWADAKLLFDAQSESKKPKE